MIIYKYIFQLKHNKNINNYQNKSNDKKLVRYDCYS